MDANDLARLLAYREAEASRRLDGETMHVAAPDGSCCWEHAMERIAALEGLLRRWAAWKDSGWPVWARYHFSGVRCGWCYAPVPHDDQGGSLEWDKTPHALGCTVGDTLKMLKELEATNDNATE